jgi:hypothetical protein
MRNSNERGPGTSVIGSITINSSLELVLVPFSGRSGSRSPCADFEGTGQILGKKLNLIELRITFSTPFVRFTVVQDGELESKLEISSASEGTHACASEDVIATSSDVNTLIEAVTFAPTFSHHRRLEDSERILVVSLVLVSRSTSRSPFSGTGDNGLSSVIRDGIRKSPRDLKRVDNFDLQGSFTFVADKFVESSLETTVTESSFTVSSIRGVLFVGG